MTYLYTGVTPGVLASGQPIAPGDTVHADRVDPEHPEDKRLLDERLLVKDQPVPDNATGQPAPEGAAASETVAGDAGESSTPDPPEAAEPPAADPPVKPKPQSRAARGRKEEK